MIAYANFKFLYPWVLLLLLLIPALGTWFLFQQRKYWRDAFNFSQVSLLKTLKHTKHPILYQRVVPSLLLIALSISILGLAHPIWRTKVATQDNYLMLTLDISLSMEATDISPNRLESAKAAAIDFVKNLPEDTKVGLELFAGNNYLITPPVTDHQLVIAYLKSLELKDLKEGTAIGDAITTALQTLQSSIHPDDTKSKADSPPPNQSQGTIILLTDGENNLGISPLQAATDAQNQHVTIDTVGMGQQTGTYIEGGIFTHLDEPTLQGIAYQTGGHYYRVKSFQDFKEIYRQISQETLHFEEKNLDLTPWCLGIAFLFTIAAFIWGIRYRRF